MKFIRKNIKIISIFILVLLSITLIVLKIYLNKKETVEIIINPIEESLTKTEELKDKEKQTIIEKVYVDIKGAIVNPGVYEIENDKKVIDVVNLAGGLTDKADTSMINLAKQVSDEMVIIIYTEEEVKKYSNPEEIIKIIDKECVCPEIKNDACINNNENNNFNNKEIDKNNGSTTSQKINLNTATIEELQTLTGVGESKAKSIIEYREEHGNFKSIEEIKNVSGIGESLYEKIKDNITI